MPGVQVELSDGPFQFDARKPHCGRNTSSESSDQTRISVAIFLLKRRSEPCLETHETLRSLGFNILGIPGPPDILPASQPTLHLFFKTTRCDKQQRMGLRPNVLEMTTTDIPEASSATFHQRPLQTKREGDGEKSDEDEVVVIKDDPMDPTEVTGDDDDVVVMVDTL